MAKLTLTDITTNRLTSIATYNSNNDLIEAALENTLSRDGTTPNAMAADIDMNGYTLVNFVFKYRSFTSTQIADVSHAVNTAGKAAGIAVWDTSNNRVMVASGAAAGDAWYIADGSTSVTPS